MSSAVRYSARRCPGGSFRGFTIVELLVSISIIALLISLLLPALSIAREAARTASCASQMRQVGILFHAWSVENKGMIPHDDQFCNGSATNHNGESKTLQNIQFWPIIYTMTQEGPEYKPGNQGFMFSTLPRELEFLKCPSLEGKTGGGWFWGWGHGTDYKFPFTNTQTSAGIRWRDAMKDGNYRLAELPTTHAMLVDGHEYTSTGQTWGCKLGGSYSNNHHVLHGGNAFVSGYVGWGNEPAGEFSQAVGDQHAEGANMLYPDGVVRRMARDVYYPNYPTNWTLVLDRQQ